MCGLGVTRLDSLLSSLLNGWWQIKRSLPIGCWQIKNKPPDWLLTNHKKPPDWLLTNQKEASWLAVDKWQIKRSLPIGQPLTHCPEEEGEAKDCEGNVPVGELPQGAFGQHVVWHDLLHSYAHAFIRGGGINQSINEIMSNKRLINQSIDSKSNNHQ